MQLSVDANYARGVNQYGFRDLNLDVTPKFTLGAEGGRPVFASPSAIVPGTGAVSIISSRIAPQFGQVIAVGSDLQSESEQLVVTAQGITRIGAIFNVSYTLSRAKDQSSASGGSATGGFSAATTAVILTCASGRPATSIVVTRSWERSRIRSTRARADRDWQALVGAPFTPMVGSDVNADGARNDRAFIFDPSATADTAVANAMRRLMNRSGSRASARSRPKSWPSARVIGIDPWQPSLDFQVNYRPFAFGLNRRLMLSVTTVNFLGGLDQLINGQKILQGWGTARVGDLEQLEQIAGTGKSTYASSYQYQVNERFGAQPSEDRGASCYHFQVGFRRATRSAPIATRTSSRARAAAAGRFGGPAAEPRGPGASPPGSSEYCRTRSRRFSPGRTRSRSRTRRSYA